MGETLGPPFGGRQHDLGEESGVLYNADSTHLLAWMPNSSVDLIVTDPPYGIHYKSNRQRVDRKKSVHGEGSITVRNHYFQEIENDGAADFAWLKDAYRVLKDGSAIYVFAHWSKWPLLSATAEEVGFNMKNMIVLNKSNHGMGDLKGSYAPKHELLLFASKGRHDLRFPFGRENDIWSVPVKFSGARKFHPNEKPLTWLTPAIANSSDAGQTVLDPFMGSGTTGMSTVRMDRRFIGCEKDTEYFDVSVSRIDQSLEQRQSNIL